MTSVLKNGTANDDLETVKGIQSNNNIALALTRSHNQTATSKALQNRIEKTAKDNRYTLLFLFISVEFFSLFGAIAKGLIASETSGAVKSIISTNEKIQSLEENVMQMVETKLINGAMQKIEDAINKLNQSPTLPHENMGNTEQIKQPNKAQIAFNANSGSNGYFMGNGCNYGITNQNLPTLPFLGAYSMPPKEEAKPEVTNDACNPCHDENKNILILDLLKYKHPDNQIILTLFDNGTIGVGDRLVKKSLVLAELEEQGVKEDDYVTLMRRLKKQKLVTFDRGYYANCKVENIVKNVS